MADVSKYPARTVGVVTFLDVIGWKGVYDRKKDALDSLTLIVDGVRSEAAKQRGRITGEIAVKSISDTIAIFTPCKENEASTAIEIHGELCAWVIPRSIISDLPVRGATSFGEFELGENIFVGKAVDEAAAWHEQSDWIGVHLTPSAEYIFQPTSGQTAWVPHTPPTKAKLDWKPHCVHWIRKWRDSTREIIELKGRFRRLGPIVPEIAAKFANTLKFVEAHKPHPE